MGNKKSTRRQKPFRFLLSELQAAVLSHLASPAGINGDSGYNIAKVLGKSPGAVSNVLRRLNEIGILHQQEVRRGRRLAVLHSLTADGMTLACSIMEGDPLEQGEESGLTLRNLSAAFTARYFRCLSERRAFVQYLKSLKRHGEEKYDIGKVELKYRSYMVEHRAAIYLINTLLQTGVEAEFCSHFVPVLHSSLTLMADFKNFTGLDAPSLKATRKNWPHLDEGLVRGLLKDCQRAAESFLENPADNDAELAVSDRPA